MIPDVKHGTVLCIRTDGTEYVLDRVTLSNIYKACEADCVDFVHIGRANGTYLYMAVDDNGYESTMVERGPHAVELVPVKARKPVNSRATELYHAVCVPGTTHQIVGDVALYHDEDFEPEESE